jgi:hypothetical protein
MPYDKIDAARIETFPLSQRRNLLDIEKLALDPAADPPELTGELQQQIGRLAQRILEARARGASVMLAYGAHLVKNGAGPLVNALIERGLVTHLATHGAGVIHDWEFSFQGASGESVRENTPLGRFGTWDETGRWIGLAVLAGAADGLGFGEAVGRLIHEDGLTLPKPDELRERIQADPAAELAGARADLLHTMERFDLPAGRLEVAHPYKAYCVLNSAYARRVPLTVHPGIGYDIIVNHPLYHGGAMGRAATTDAHVFARSVDRLEGGVYVSVGSAIMSPQVFEKALSVANNLRRSGGRPFIREHCLAIVDVQDGGGWDWSRGEPPDEHPAYYLRYCKTFHRMGGTLQYLQCDNRLFLAGLLDRLRSERGTGPTESG